MEPAAEPSAPEPDRRSVEEGRAGAARGLGDAVLSITGPVCLFVAAAAFARALPAGPADSPDVVMRAAQQSVTALGTIAAVLVDPIATPAGRALIVLLVLTLLARMGITFLVTQGRQETAGYIEEGAMRRLVYRLGVGVTRWPVGAAAGSWIFGWATDLQVWTVWVAGCAGVLAAGCAAQRQIGRRRMPVGTRFATDRSITAGAASAARQAGVGVRSYPLLALVLAVSAADPSMN